jgi:hypothetical protein
LQNIEKAQAEIDRLEAEAVAADNKESKASASKPNGAAKDGSAEITSDLNKTKIDGEATTA